MNTKAHIFSCWLTAMLMLTASACQAQSTPAAVASVPSLPPPPPADTPTPPFLGAIPVALPAERADQAGDVDTSPNAYKKVVSGGDVFVRGLYERPFNSDPMDKYFPYLDIIETQGLKDETWGYATIAFANTDSNGELPGQYAVELDLNKDGRGDWLIRAADVSETEWTTKGVQAWNDSNGDVGGSKIMSPDGHQSGNGYEELVFDEGKTDLVDGAWARINPDDPKTVEIAFKLSMVGDPASYAMGSWAGTSLDPVMFDHNDAMTHIQAGSPLYSYTVYPLKELAEIDNTCRLAIGFAPTGKEPGLCATAQREREAEGGSGSGQEYCYVVGAGMICVPVP